MIAGSIAKKYRCLNHLKQMTGLSRRSMANVVDKNLVNSIQSETRLCKARRMQSQGLNFSAVTTIAVPNLEKQMQGRLNLVRKYRQEC